MDAPEPRLKLLLAAEEAFARKGYDGATVRDICERAGMNVAAVNYHFGDKETLYVEAVKHAHRTTCTVAGLAESVPPNAPPREELRHVIRHMLRQMHGPARPSALQLLMRELGQPSQATRAVVDDFIRPMATHLRDVLRRAMPGAAEEAVTMAAFSVVGQCLFYRQNRAVAELLVGAEMMERLDLDTVTGHVTRFTLAALDPERSAS